MNTQPIAAHAPLKYTPAFFDPAKAYMDYQPDLEGAYLEGVAYAQKTGLESAAKLIASGKAHAMWITDLQKDFGDNGRLPVSGTFDVVLRTVVRLLNGVVGGYYGGVIESRDGHPGQHISYASYWRDQNGVPLDLRQLGNACMLTLQDEDKAVFKATGFNPDGSLNELGYYQPRFDATPAKSDNSAVAYWQHLQATGQGDIWAFNQHCKLGTDGANTHPFLLEALTFAEGALSMQETIVNKGHISTTDWFGAFEPCMPDASHPQGGLQKGIIDGFKPFVTVDAVGVAEDFCVFHGLRQVMDYLGGTEYFGKLRFVEDCTAPIVPNAQHVQDQYVEAKAKGMQFIAHDAAMVA